jgi:diaminopimelate epimerase
MSNKNNINYSIYSGAGNDFVMINNLDNIVSFGEQAAFSKKICETQFPKLDGVIFLEKPQSEDNSIRMNYYNRDGSYGAMCGNGARCIAQYAVDKDVLSKSEFNLEAVNKVYKAQIFNNNIVKIYFPPPTSYRLNLKIDKVNGLNTITGNYMLIGSDHLVIFIKDEGNKEILNSGSLDEMNIELWGSVLRYHPDFAPSGANVNFADVFPPHELRVRTYERGVERETLACGTGIISTAVLSSLLKKVSPPVKVLSQSGEWLTVDFNISGNNISNLSLEGPAKKIGEGEIDYI